MDGWRGKMRESEGEVAANKIKYMLGGVVRDMEELERK